MHLWFLHVKSQQPSFSSVLSLQSFFPSHVNDFGIHFSFEQVNESFGQPKPAVVIGKESYIDMSNHISWSKKANRFELI